MRPLLGCALALVPLGCRSADPAVPARADPTPATATDWTVELALLDESDAAAKEPDYGAAGAKASAAIDALLARPEPERDGTWLELLDRAARAAWDAQAVRDAARGWQVALDIRTRTLPDDHMHLQKTRLNLAAALGQLGDPRSSRALEEKVLEVFSRTLPDDDELLQGVRQNYAATLHSLGDLPAARVLYEKLVDVYSRTLPDDHPYLWESRHGLATTLYALGELQSARRMFERNLAALSDKVPEEHPYLLGTRQNLASVVKKLGDLPGSRALEEKVLEIRSRTLPDDHPDVQSARVNLAASTQALGDNAAARQLYEKVLEVFSRTVPDDNLDLLRVRQNLGVVLRDLGDLSGAREIEESTLEILSRSLPDDHDLVQDVRQNLARTMRASGELRGARELLERVVEARTSTLPDDHPALQSARMVLADAIAAETLLESRAGGDRSAEILRGKERCIELYSARCRSQTRFAQDALLGGSAREAQARCEHVAKGLGAALSFAAGYGALGPSPELDRPCFVLSETTRGAARASAELMRLAEGSADYAALRDELRARSEELAALVQAATTSGEFAEALSRRESVEQKLTSLAIARSGGGAVKFSTEALEEALDDDAAMIAYRSYRRSAASIDEAAAPAEGSFESLCAFVVGPAEEPGSSRTLTLVDLGPIAPIEGAVRTWRAEVGFAREARGLGVVGTATTHGGTGDAARELRRIVFDPLRAHMRPAERVVVVLDGVLHLVPFDTLPEEDGSLLGDRLRIETRITTTELLSRTRESAAASGLVAVGGVDYGGGDVAAGTSQDLRGGLFSEAFSALPGTREEAESIARMLRETEPGASVKLLEGSEATREMVVELAPRARWLHVATHGWFAPESVRSWKDAEPLDKLTGLGSRLSGGEQVKGMSPMLLCGLALAGANASESAAGRVPGLITAEEISALDLSQCELAVLSACETHVGVRRAGQGVASLQQALQMAGARSVITSLWKVPDEATRELMTDFYRRIWLEKAPKGRSLWEAKKKLRDAVDERGQPRYSLRDWGAWVLTGEPD